MVVDLDIYYEASNNIPVRLNRKTNEILAPLGCKVEILNSTVASTSNLTQWGFNETITDSNNAAVLLQGSVATFEPGFPSYAGGNEVDYAGVSFKFTKEDGSFVIMKAGNQEANPLLGTSASSSLKTKIAFEEKIDTSIRVGLAWNNCFSFGNGLESNRIRDGFNEMYLVNGVKASTTTQRTYKEERRLSGLIYSGLYNSQAGVNDLNQFIMAEKITKDLSPTFGSIQKLFQRRISLIAFCEDRVISITSNKDALYNADGNPQLVATNLVLGDANPFSGNFGISKNPESFASESYRAYFTDKQRGTVIRLSKDGLTPVSDSGMHDYFRDNLPKYSSLIGTYDSYKGDYNLTLSHSFGENIIFNTYLQSGGQAVGAGSGGLRNVIENASIYNGNNLYYPYEVNNVLSSNVFTWRSANNYITSNIMVTNHAAIPEGSLQQEVLSLRLMVLMELLERHIYKLHMNLTR